MKILLFRTAPSIMNTKNYNSQEIGLAKAYVEQGHQCDIVYYNGGNPTRKEIISLDDGRKITLFWWKGFSIFNNGFFPGIKQLLLQYDVIQVSEYYFFSSWYVYSRFRKQKKVYIYQGVYDSDNSLKFKIRCKLMDPILLNKGVLHEVPVFTKSRIAFDSMKMRGFQRIQTVGVGLDTSRFDKKKQLSGWALDLLAQKKDSKYLLYVGVLEDRRNILFLLEILNNLVNNRQQNKLKLVIVGKGKKSYLDQCKKYVSKNHLEQYIIYIESIRQEEISNIYRISDIFVFPSKYEIFGMVLLEAMTFGLPVVSSYNGGASTIITDGVDGIIIDNFCIKNWADSIERLLNDESAREKLAFEAQKTASSDFGWGKIANAILENLELQ